MAETTEKQVWLTLAGLIMVAGTLIFTAIAASAARDAVKATYRTVEETKRLGEIELRAYLTLRPKFRWVAHPVDNREPFLKLSVEITNSGQTPAKECITHSHAIWIGINNKTYDPVPHLKRREGAGIYCGPRATIPSVDVDAQPEQIRDAIAKKQMVLVFVRITYDDIFEQEQRFVDGCFTAEIFEIPPNDEKRIGASVSLKTYPNHNRAN